MENIQLNMDFPPYNTSLPPTNQLLLARYRNIFTLFREWAYFQRKSEKIPLYQSIQKTLYEIQYHHRNLPQVWRKEIETLNTWVNKRFFALKKGVLNERSKTLQKTESCCFSSMQREEIKDPIDSENTYPVAEEVFLCNDRKHGPIYALTGRVTRIPLDSPISPQLQRTLALGEEIIRHTRSFIRHSQNFFVRNPLVLHLTDSAPIDKDLLYLQKQVSTLFSITLAFTHDPSGRANVDYYELLKESGVGNCAQMSLFGLLYAKEKKQVPDLIEPMVIENGDHAFLMINRSVICDPWSGSCYPTEKTPLHLRDFIGVNAQGISPIVKPVSHSQMTFAYFMKPFDRNAVERGDLAAVEEFLHSHPDLIFNDIPFYNELLQTALDHEHLAILSLLLQKGDPHKIYPSLLEEILLGAALALIHKKTDTATTLDIFSQLQQMKISPTKYAEAIEHLLHAPDQHSLEVIELLSDRKTFSSSLTDQIAIFFAMHNSFSSIVYFLKHHTLSKRAFCTVVSEAFRQGNEEATDLFRLATKSGTEELYMSEQDFDDLIEATGLSDPAVQLAIESEKKRESTESFSFYNAASNFFYNAVDCLL